MTITETKEGTRTLVTIDGRLDTVAAPSLTEKLNELLKDDVAELIIDMEKCDYVASSGLRVIISAQMSMTKKGGTMIVKNVCDTVMEVFEMTGFTNILTFE